MYEYAVTFDREVAHVWTKKPSATSFLLLSIRWVMVLTQLANVIPPKPSTCKSLSCMMAIQDHGPRYIGVLPLRSSQACLANISHQLRDSKLDI